MPPEPSSGITVVIPTRDRLPLLKEAIGSVFAQRYVDWQLVVVDDASTDGTAAWLSGLPDHRVRVVRRDDGVERSAARNLGLAEVRTPYVLFLDDDDVLRRRAFSHLAHGLARHPEAFAAVGARAIFDEAGHRRRWPWPRWTVCRTMWPEVLAGWIAVGGQTLFRTDVIREAGGWCEDMNVAEDQELWLRLGHTRPAVVIGQTVLGYRIHGLSRFPGDTRVIERELREEFIASLPDVDRRVGDQAMIAWRAIIASNYGFLKHEHRRCVAELLRAGRAAPWLFTSPVTGPGLWDSLAKYAVASVLPRRAGLALEGAVHGVREVLRGMPRGRVDDPDAPEFWGLPFELPEKTGNGQADARPKATPSPTPR